MSAPLKVHLVHDWLVTPRGGEQVLDALCELFPQAELYTLLHRPGSVSPRIEARPIHTSFLQHVPGIHRRYRSLLPLFPRAIESLRLSPCDLVISSSHCVAKGVRVPAGAKHLSYVHAPMRYMWDLFDDYFGPGRASLPVRWGARVARPFLQAWDRQSAAGVDHFLANSRHIAGKVQRFWGRESTVVHPPVQLERFTTQPLAGNGAGGYFLWLGAFAPYKRLDLALEAFSQTGQPLWIAGGGQEEALLRSRPWPSNIRFIGSPSDEAVPELYRQARALVFTGEEDFGITPVESLASGRPVVAFARGGALETLTDRVALFFAEQTVDGLVAALRSFDGWESSFRPEEARLQAERFSKKAFQARIREQVEALLPGRKP